MISLSSLRSENRIENMLYRFSSCIQYSICFRGFFHGCHMNWRVYAQTSFYQENLAFSYAPSRISLVFCRSLGFLIPWSSSLTAESDLVDFFVLCMEKKVGGLYLIVCKNYNSLTCLNAFFALFNFDNI
jgi:hypothetical protein